MKLPLALCLVVYLLQAEVSGKPTPEFMQDAREMMEKAKASAQEAVSQAVDQAQEAFTGVIEAARNAMQTGFKSVQQTAQEKVGLGEFTAQNQQSMTQKTPGA